GDVPFGSVRRPDGHVVTLGNALVEKHPGDAIGGDAELRPGDRRPALAGAEVHGDPGGPGAHLAPEMVDERRSRYSRRRPVRGAGGRRWAALGSGRRHGLRRIARGFGAAAAGRAATVIGRWWSVP